MWGCRHIKTLPNYYNYCKTTFWIKPENLVCICVNILNKCAHV